jgi:amino acid transporter
VRSKDIDLYTGMREGQLIISGEGVPEEQRRQSVIILEANKPMKWYDYPKGFLSALF